MNRLLEWYWRKQVWLCYNKIEKLAKKQKVYTNRQVKYARRIRL